MNEKSLRSDIMDGLFLKRLERYFEEHPEYDKKLLEICKHRFYQAGSKYGNSWQEWPIEHLVLEAQDELADYINYQMFIRLRQEVVNDQEARLRHWDEFKEHSRQADQRAKDLSSKPV